MLSSLWGGTAPARTRSFLPSWYHLFGRVGITARPIRYGDAPCLTPKPASVAVTPSGFRRNLRRCSAIEMPSLRDCGGTTQFYVRLANQPKQTPELGPGIRGSAHQKLSRHSGCLPGVSRPPFWLPFIPYCCHSS